MKKMLSEFKEFIARGNVLDMAIGIVVGSAFTAIVNSLVNDLIMPFIGWIIGGMSFSDLRVVLKPAEGEVAEVAIRYGAFIEKIINFLLVAFVIFMVVKAINKMREKASKKVEEAPAPEEPAAPAEDIVLLTEIRDLLKK